MFELFILYNSSVNNISDTHKFTSTLSYPSPETYAHFSMLYLQQHMVVDCNCIEREQRNNCQCFVWMSASYQLHTLKQTHAWYVVYIWTVVPTWNRLNQIQCVTYCLSHDNITQRDITVEAPWRPKPNCGLNLFTCFTTNLRVCTSNRYTVIIW